jgi:DNA-directed RNA polymerase subunit RPC12/RpoP
MTDETFDCGTCDRTVSRDEARRSETYGGLDPEKWQTLCCPDCGSRLKTVFVGRE